MTLPATSRHEVPAFFPAGDETLFGILTRPTGTSNGTAAIVLTGGGAPISTNINRISVRMCRRLAAKGFHTLRFDYHGVGESTGIIERFRLDEPFTNDLSGVIDWVREQGIHKFVLIGSSCFGSRTALSAAPHLEGLQAIVLNSAPVRDFEMGERVGTKLALEWSLWDYFRNAMRQPFVRRLRQAKWRRRYARVVKAKWRTLRTGQSVRKGSGASEAHWLTHVSDMFVEPLLDLAKSEIPVLLIYGEDDDLYSEFQRAQQGRLGAIVNHSSVELALFPGSLHGLSNLEAQENFSNLVGSWLPRKVSPSN